jgi:hypothetical protein
VVVRARGSAPEHDLYAQGATLGGMTMSPAIIVSVR